MQIEPKTWPHGNDAIFSILPFTLGSPTTSWHIKHSWIIVIDSWNWLFFLRNLGARVLEQKGMCITIVSRTMCVSWQPFRSG